jgi:hypothetical protein
VACDGWSRRRGRVVGYGCQFLPGPDGVDLIAVLALAGAMVVGELLAAAVISVILTSGRALKA